ncbi:MAG: DUF1264 domain-containing protein, partial [Nitrospinaceae bacterium]|nr:OBAP family protein [Nitrospinaceae bacterium]NIS83680.1 OBAP family protein [Nitrospinaceae bacterium]NIT80479.1 OBAP family protein [Nitrospinaceae bacterium]NIU94878.1 DUF1264 domain-containing protein [Nitrospinaceae bacterium]NIY13477.1 DUF1264 domain-containing protein [Nitrospinaceae bacterium]
MRIPLRTIAVLLLILGIARVSSAGAEVPTVGPLAGFTLHFTAPHVMNNEVTPSYHHYCQAAGNDILQCLVFDSDEPGARLVEIEYLVPKRLTKQFVPEWRYWRHWHDNGEEVATGRLVVVKPTSTGEKKTVEKTLSGTDSLIFHLWPEGAPFPDGSVRHPQSVGHW